MAKPPFGSNTFTLRSALAYTANCVAALLLAGLVSLAWLLTAAPTAASVPSCQPCEILSSNVALVFATDGRIPSFRFVILRDDRGYFPSYALTPVVRKQWLDANPKAAEALNTLSAKLDDATMARLNAAVDVEKKKVEEEEED